MADDQNQQGQQGNAARIQAMLNDLARARAAARNANPPASDSERVSKAPQGDTQQARPTPPPVNLPTGQGGQPPPRPVPPPQSRPAPQAPPQPRPTPPSIPTPQPQKPAPTPPRPVPPPQTRPTTPSQQPRPTPSPQPVPTQPRPTPPPAPQPQKPAPTPPRPVPPPPPAAPRPPAPPPAPKPVAPPTPKPAPPPAPREITQPSVPKPPTPVTPPQKPTTPSPVTTELRTMSGDISQIQVGKAPEGIRSAAPTAFAAKPAPTPSPRPTSAQSVTVPEETGKKKRGRTLLLAAFGTVVLVMLILIIGSLFGEDDSSPTPTPTPSASVSLTPAVTVRTLLDYFGEPRITASVDNIVASFATADPNAKQVIPIAITKVDGRQATPNEMLDVLFTNTPQAVVDAIIGFGVPETEGVLLAYGQTESFDDAGQPITDILSVRPVLVIEITNASAVNQQIQAWEISGIAESATGPFSVDTSKALVVGFSSGTHGQIPIRYWNFPYADRSIDWAILLASNGKNYLLISSSRQSMFFAIDRLLR